jgi:hypothetical protein
VNLSLQNFPGLFSFSLLIFHYLMLIRKPKLTIFCKILYLFFISKKTADLSGGITWIFLDLSVLVFFFFRFHNGFFGPELFLYLTNLLVIWAADSCGIHFIPFWLKQHDGGGYTAEITRCKW